MRVKETQCVKTELCKRERKRGKGKGKSVLSDNEESCVQLAEGKRVVERRRELEREKEKKDKREHFT